MPNENLGVRILAWRTKAGLTQRELGELVGVSDAAVCQWESGDVAPQADRLSRIASACGVGLSRFFGKLPRISARGKS